MNSHRFEVGDKVICHDKITTIVAIQDHTKDIQALTVLITLPEVQNHPFTYRLADGRHAWDYQLILAEIYNSPLSNALREEILIATKDSTK